MPVWNQGLLSCRPTSVGLDAPEESSQPPAQISSSPRRWDGPPASIPQRPHPECPANSEAVFTDLRGLAGMEQEPERGGFGWALPHLHQSHGSDEEQEETVTGAGEWRSEKERL